MEDIYVSVDVEADGPIPGEYSMLSFGLAIAASYDGSKFAPRDPSQSTFYRELKPISPNFDPKALEVAAIDRDSLAANGAEPITAMTDARNWVLREAQDRRPVLVGYPIVFDWMFMHWYFVKYTESSPFGFSGAIDMKTMYQQKAKVTLDHAGRRDLPSQLKSKRAHTHNALDDAIEQAEIFNNLFAWSGVQ